MPTQPTTSYNRGDVLLLAFPFTSGTGAKQRPALVILDTRDQDVLVARITSQPHSSTYDVAVAHWKQAGLLAPSIARIHKLATIERALIRRKLATLTQPDLSAVQTALARILRP